jgi:hypothetical protein
MKLYHVTSADRGVTFWAALHPRLARLSNLVGDADRFKVLEAINVRIPMPTPDEQRRLQKETQSRTNQSSPVHGDDLGSVRVVAIAGAVTQEGERGGAACSGSLVWGRSNPRFASWQSHSSARA